MNTRARLSIALGGTAIAALAIFYTGKWEGLRTKAYRDMIGVPTICYGNTTGVKMGDTATKEQCDERLAADLLRHWNGIAACAPSIKNAPDGFKVAMLDLAYNIGVGAWCGSSLRRLTEEKRYRQACDKTLEFVYARGEYLRGLENRRRDLHKVCVKDLDKNG